MYENRVEICQVDGRPLDDLGGDPVVGRTFSRKYRVIRKLGGGDLGAVYQAEELATGNMVAVKLFHEDLSWDPEYVKQCRWEARFAAASNPAYIARVYEVDQSDQGRVFIVMEYLEGHSVADVIRREGALEVSRALRLANEIAQALATATKAGVTHRNLKPQNVMVVGPDDRAKVTDFGVARLRETASGGRARLGGGEYAAPEQLKSGEVTDRTDIYSLGAVLYTMLTGLPPSTPRGGAGGAGDLRDTPTPVRKLRPEVPVALEQFVMRAMDRQPALRQSGIWEFIDGLRELADAVALGTAPASPSVAAPRKEPAEPEPVELRPADLRPAELTPAEVGEAALRSAAPGPDEGEPSPKPAINGTEKRLRYADLLRSRRDTSAPVLPALDHRRRYADVSKHSRLAGWKRLLPRPESRPQAAALRARLDRGKVAVSGLVTPWLDRELWRSRLASSTRGLAGSVDRWRHATRWPSGLGGWKWSSRPGGRIVLAGAAGLVVAAVTAWVVLSGPGGGARGPTPVASTPTTVAQPDSETSVIEQASPVGQPEIAPKPVVPVTPEQRPAEAARTDRDRSRQVEAARRAEEQRRQAEVEASRRGEEERRRQAEVEASRRAEEAQRQRGEVEAARRAEEEQRRQTEAEASRRAEEERRPQAEAEATRRAEEVAAARRQAEAEAARARAQAVPPVPVKPALPVLSAPELARIRAQAEQKLTGRGLLRMSGSDRWGVMVEVGSTGEIALSGTLRDISLYQEAIRLVRGVPGVQDVKATGVSVSELGAVSPAQSDAAGIRAEIQARLRSRGLLRESPTDRWGVTVEVGAGGDVTLGGVVRDAGLQGEAIRLVQGISGVQNVKQDIRVMEGAGRQGTSSSP